MSVLIQPGSSRDTSNVYSQVYDLSSTMNPLDDVSGRMVALKWRCSCLESFIVIIDVLRPSTIGRGNVTMY